jgi:hypothetical protein
MSHVHKKESARTTQRKHTQRKRRFGAWKRRPLSLEQLEMRALLTSGLPHVNLAGTTGDDALVLDTDPLNSSMLRVWSTTGTLPSVSFPKSGLISLTIDGSGGTDSITVAADVAIGGGAVQLMAESITIGAGTSISGAGEVTLLAVAQGALTATGTEAAVDLQARILVEGNISTAGSLRIEAIVDNSAILDGVGSSLTSTSAAVAQIGSTARIEAGNLTVSAVTNTDFSVDITNATSGTSGLGATIVPAGRGTANLLQDASPAKFYLWNSPSASLQVMCVVRVV